MARPRPRKQVATLALASALAACGAEPQQEAPAAPELAASPASPPAETRAPAKPAAAEIPARFLGVWDAGDCSATSETRLEVAARRLEYYESVGTLTAIEAANGGDVVLTLAMTGEGQSWVDRVRLQRTSVDGREALLVLPGPGSDVVLRPVPLWRCPA